eukprot:30400-Pelagococcus_subviridis.AAC.6
MSATSIAMMPISAPSYDGVNSLLRYERLHSSNVHSSPAMNHGVPTRFSCAHAPVTPSMAKRPWMISAETLFLYSSYVREPTGEMRSADGNSPHSCRSRKKISAGGGRTL